jgi:hypothetical protein
MDVPLRNAVDAWKIAAAPPPPIRASDHFRRGLISAILNAVARVPVMTAAGAAMASIQLSTQGI